MQSSKIDRIKDLVEQLNAASESYYAKDQEIMSNYEYDKLYDELVELEKETGVTLVLNFIFAFVNRRFTENGLVYLLLNIVVGVVPYIGLTLRHSVRPPMAWVICLVISMITFLGLVIFKGRSLLAEFEKRLHL